MLTLACRFTAEQTHRGLAINTQVDTGERHGGWVTTDSWITDSPADEASLVEQLHQHGWRLASSLDTEPAAENSEVDVIIADIEPEDWQLVVERASAASKQAEHVYTARNGLIAAVPRDTMSAIDLAKTVGVGRHRIYQLQGYGKEPGFTF